MIHVVFASEAQANRFASDIDRELGLPRDGVQAGPGPHATTAEGRTVRFAIVRKHPARNEWAYPDDPIVVGQRTRVPLPAGTTSKELDSDWYPRGGAIAVAATRERRT